MKKLIIFTVVLLVQTLSIHAQDWQYFDSLRNGFQQNHQFDSAMFYAKKALHSIKDDIGEKDTLYANALTTLVVLNFYSGDYQKAIEYAEEEKAVRALIQGKSHSDYASAINNLAILYRSLGDYVAAEPLYIEAMSLNEKIFGSNHPVYATSLNNLALLYYYKGDYPKAKKLFKQSLSITKEPDGDKNPEHASTLNNLALVKNALGEYALAERLYNEALDIRKNVLGENHPHYAASLNNLAEFYYTMGNYTLAENLFNDALRIENELYGEDHPDYAITLNNLASFYEQIGNNEKAKELYLQAIKIIGNFLGKNHPTYAILIDNLAYLYQELQELELAEDLYLKSLKIYKEILGETHPDYAKSLNNLGVLYKDMKRFEEAEKLLIESKDLLANAIGENHSNYIRVMNSLALLYQEMGMYHKAEKFFVASIDNTNKNISLNFTFLSEKEKEAYFKMHEYKFDAFYSFALKRKENRREITQLVYNNTLKNKGLLLKSSTAMRTAILSSNDKELIGKYDEWIALKKEIANLYFQEISKREKDPDEIEQQANEMERALVRKSQTFGDFEKMQRVTWQSVRDKLKPSEAAIEFIHFTQTGKQDTVIYAALIVTPETQYPKMIGLFYEYELESILGRFAENNLHYVNDIYGTIVNPNTQLYKLIWEPLEEYLTETKTIYLSPSGLLHKVSFASMPKDRNVFLCDTYSLHIQSSTAKVVLPSRFELGNNFSASIFGGINYNTENIQEEVWNYLAGTRQEAYLIKNLLTQQQIRPSIYTGNESTEEVVKQASAHSNILHVATHGFFYPNPKEQQQVMAEQVEKGDIVFRGGRGTRGFGVWGFVMNPNPLMRSGLTFAGANRVWTDNYVSGDKDGILTAEEVISIDMRNTNLVVLSACETGLGEIKGSEGVYGLQRAFKMAGVQYIIMSLWQVPDSETVEFMEIFYKNLLSTNNIRGSFAETQNAMRQKYDPYYWAAFVLLE